MINKGKSTAPGISLKRLLLFRVVVVTLVFIFGGKEGGMVDAAIASISSVIMLFQGAAAWEGTVIDTCSREPTVTQRDMEGRQLTHQVITDYANVKLQNGGFKEGACEKAFWDIENKASPML